MSFEASQFLNARMAVYISVSNRSQHAWGKTGGAGGMRLVTPLHPEGPEGPAKQGAGVGVAARLQSTMTGGSWSSVPPSLCSPAGAPRRQATGGVRRSRGRRARMTRTIIGFYEVQRTQTEGDGKFNSDTMQLTTSSNELTH